MIIIKSTALRVIFGEMYVSYDAAMEMTGLKALNTRREEQCLSYALKAVKHPVNNTKFPKKNVESSHKEREQYHVNFAQTEAYGQSAVPSLQRLLNARAPELWERWERVSSQFEILAATFGWPAEIAPKKGLHQPKWEMEVAIRIGLKAQKRCIKTTVSGITTNICFFS